jgi:hypothetical protein
MNDLNLQGNFYYDPSRENDERSDFHRRLAEKRSTVEKLHIVEDASGSITELERTRKQKDILEALEKVSW